MIAQLHSDAGMRVLAGRLHAGPDPDEVVARAAWSVVAEPGDGTAGALIAGMGPVQALVTAFGTSGDPRGEALAVESLGGDGGARMLADGRRRWQPRAEAGAVHRALSAASEAGASLVIPGDPSWPTALDDLGPHAPVLLWVRGDATHLVASPHASIVGARASTSYGDTVTADIAGDLAGAGVVVVSGGAYGIDGAAHRAALAVGGATVAFLAGGVDRSYPMGHHQLFERIVGAGAVVAEVPCGTAPTKWRFLSRNRLIAALGTATVVVEAGMRSGSLNTAGHASALGRPLGAVPGPITSAASAGCHRLLREYDARCVTSAAEVRELWGDASGITGAPRLRTDPEVTRLADAMSSRTPLAPDELARRSGMSVDHVRALLGTLELEGAVERRERGWVRRSGSSG